MKTIGKLIACLLLIGGGVYYHSYYPPVVKERAAAKALADFTKAVNGKDRAKISAVLAGYLTEDAKVHLSIGFFSLTQEAKMTEQDFTRESFITFIDNVLYSMTDWGYESSLSRFKLSPDRSGADSAWWSLAWADGASYYQGVGVNMRFSTNPECSGKIIFAGDAPKLSDVNCKIVIQAVPKPGEESKLQSNPGALGQYLR